MKILRTITFISLIQFIFIVSMSYFNSKTLKAIDLYKSQFPTPTSSDLVTSETAPNLSPTSTQTPSSKTIQPPKSTPKPTPNIQPQKDPNLCLIKIDGNTYDLTEFIALHSGGDIFQCNTDMTNIFYDQHSNSYLSQLTKYKL